MELYPIDLAIHLVNIAVLYLMLRRLIWKPVRKFMVARETRVQAQMDEATQMQAQAELAKSEYDSRLAQAETACEQMLAEGRKQAMQSGQKHIDAAHAEAKQIIAQAREDASEEKQRAMDDAKGQLANIAVDLAGRVLRFDEQTRQNVAEQQTQKQGRRSGTLKTARPCSDEALQTITDRLETLLGCHLDLEVEEDPALVGGFAAYIGGKVYDFSYAAQLAAMKQKLA